LIGGNRGGAGGEYSSFGNVMVDEDCYGIIALGRGKFGDEVHGDGGKRGSIGFWEDRLEQSRRAVGEIFCRLASSTTVNIILDKASHTSPPEGTREEFIGLQMTRVTGTRCIMMKGDDVMVEFRVMRDIQSSFAEDRAIGDCPVF